PSRRRRMIASRSVGPRGETYSSGIGTLSSPVAAICPLTRSTTATRSSFGSSGSAATPRRYVSVLKQERPELAFRSAIRGWHHLTPLHAEARSEPSATDAVDEATDRASESLPLLSTERAEVPQEALGDRIGRHD